MAKKEKNLFEKIYTRAQTTMLRTGKNECLMTRTNLKQLTTSVVLKLVVTAMAMITLHSNAQVCEPCDVEREFYSDIYKDSEFTDFGSNPPLPVSSTIFLSIEYGKEISHNIDDYASNWKGLYFKESFISGSDSYILLDTTDYDKVRQITHDTLMARLGTSVSPSIETGKVVCGNILFYFDPISIMYIPDRNNYKDTYSYRQSFEDNPYYVYYPWVSYPIDEEAAERILRDKIGFFIMFHPDDHVYYVVDVQGEYLTLADQGEGKPVLDIARKVHINEFVNNDNYSYFWLVKNTYIVE